MAAAAEVMVEEATEDVEREVDAEVGEADLVDEVAERGKENEEETKVEEEE